MKRRERKGRGLEERRARRQEPQARGCHTVHRGSEVVDRGENTSRVLHIPTGTVSSSVNQDFFSRWGRVGMNFTDAVLVMS
jgi:hypothetical protein